MKTLQVTAITLVTALTLLFSPALTHAQGWYPGDWQFRKEITIYASQVPTTLDNFPVLVEATASAAQTDGKDILFTDYTGIVKLAHEIESYDDGSGALVAWVKIPTLDDTTDTVIYLYYGNSDTGIDPGDPTEVWDDNYAMVQHLEETSGDHLDSTSFLNHGTPSTVPPIQGTASGQINGADGFNGSSNYVDCGVPATLDITGSMTVEAWVYSENGTADSKRIACKDPVGSKGKFIFWKNTGEKLAFQVTDSDTWSEAISDTTMPDGEWMYVVGVFDAAAQKVRLYTNGNEEIIEVDGPSTLKETADRFTIGAASTNDHYWNGTIDEVRVSNTARSADWILTSHNNQNDPSLFYGIDVEEQQCTVDGDCDDEDICTGAETCDAGTCQPGTPLDCDDGNLCTTDGCDPATGCDNQAVACPPGETCDPADGQCKECTVDGDCDDGDVCTGDETCDAGTCLPGTPLDCDDGNLCTTDGCDPATGCDNQAVACPPGETCDPADGQCKECTVDGDCDDGDVCTGDETCDAGTCLPGTPLDCDDGNLCTTDGCDPATGCDNQAVACPPGETCDPADGQCKECTVDGDCDDGDVCTGDETCDAGTCLPGTPLGCDDGDVCNGAETCDPMGGCQPGTPLDCDDGNLCTTDGCDPATGCDNQAVACPPGETCDPADGQCKECTVDGDCDDGDVCTGDETCDAGTCLPGTPLDCDDGNLCTTDGCDPATGCDNQAVACPPGETCDPADGQCKECTVDGDCDDEVVCTDDTCVGNACVNNPNNDNCPDDELYCTGDEFCDASTGCSSTGDPCTSPEVCDVDSDQCVAAAPGSWWNCAWPYRKELTIDPTYVDEDLTNFPVLVDVTVSAAQPDGEDIVFTDINGTQLSHEIELYDDGTGQVIAWVKVESLSSTVDTTLFMYFGNDVITSSQEDVEGTWDENYVMVQHLNETSGDHIDSTSSLNDGTPFVTTQGMALGQIDGADGFDGDDDLVVVPDSETLDITGSMTVEAWAFSAGGTTGPIRILSKDMTGTAGKFILWKNNDGDLAFIVADDRDIPDPWYRAIGSPVTDGVWFQVVGVFDADDQQVRLYKDGDEVDSVLGPASIQSNTETVTIGASDDNDHNWAGVIDEARISSTARSGGWIKTSHNNQDDPDSFFTPMGDLEDQCEGNFDCDLDVDGSDAQLFKLDFGRPFQDPPPQRPCTDADPCNGDFNCDGDVDGGDALVFLQDFGRSQYFNPCPPCVEGECCSYQ